MICWQCGKPLVDAMRRPVKGVRLLVGCHPVRVHKICEASALEFLRQITAQPSEQLRKTP